MQTLEKIITLWAAVCDFSERDGILSHPAPETQCAAFEGEVKKDGCLGVAAD